MNRNAYMYAIGSGGVAFILMVAIISAWVSFTTASTCQRAQKNSPSSDCVTALTARLSDESQSYSDRNDAIWALGQLGDERALPVLQQHFTGQIPQQEPWNETLSQYELQKAIGLLNGGWNITSLLRVLVLQ